MNEPINKIRPWQMRAREIADEADTAGTKKAVQETEMTEEEREAARQLFASYHDTIEEVCRFMLRNQQPGEKTPPLQLDDLLQESYVHFLRALVRYDPGRGELDQYLRHALRSRLKRYVQSKSTRREDREERDPIPSTTSFRRYDVVAITQELVDEGLGDEDRWNDLTA